ncbi:response regulator [Desulfosediminicola flagellatus]|uniref:response regulator n=1 Tax=Desulfosediminicola flagellatus TaxID=2569541 RepID=UPI0010AD6422|nr:response regulator [Desulfosediminicola flagellatus]
MTDNTMKQSVLIMDDEEMVGEIACQLIAHLGYEATHVKDGQEAVTEYISRFEAGNPYSVVIMDLTIPGGMGGKEAVGEILKIDPEAKVLVSSGYSTDPIMANFSDYGFSGVINKPFDLMAIKSALESMCK